MAKVFDTEVLAINAVTASVLTPAKYDHRGSSRASKAVIQVGTTPIYFLFATSTPAATPTATEGFFGNVGDTIEVTDFDDIRNLQVIAQSGSGTIYVSYET